MDSPGGASQTDDDVVTFELKDGKWRSMHALTQGENSIEGRLGCCGLGLGAAQGHL